ncbi:MAG: TIGR02221 family CRISPR-associated protein [Candidatus Cyclonatronum sp.]|uniref:TIGR02221 family CRISPR-associated protein n=1 Tax=Cyclonatronum sp. TaxID=3024185 RepID=UPI0025B7B396|nr:TIGR02221 family CRISPR-associated protein [Cyclonatronum sp.]MCH8487481.1 TIGR02221 family CRISPR-associated protein [Cyclonatronum sp.]
MGKLLAISFLGTTSYEVTTYIIDKKHYQERYIQKAINDHYKPEKHFIFATTFAMEKHRQGMIDCGFQVQDFVPIPDGKSESELWDLFGKVVKQVPEGSRLVVDVTHGFRIQPMVALAVVVFLRFQKNVRVEAIRYGLFEKGSETNEVLDITSFLDIIDWTFGIRRLIEKGDGSDLADILKNLHGRSYKNNELHKAKGLTNFGSYVNGIMQSLSVVRPLEVMQEASRARTMTDELKLDLQMMPHTQPLQLFAEEILQKLDEYAAPVSDISAIYSKQGIQAQLAMIDHYLEVNQYQQALTLINELLIGLALVLHSEETVKPNKRKQMSDRLHAIRKDIFIGKIEQWEPEIVEIIKLSSDYRNDVNHAGMRDDPKSAGAIIKQTSQLAEKTRRFVEKHIPGFEQDQVVISKLLKNIKIIELRDHLPEMLDQVEQNNETLVIERDSGEGAVLISKKEYNSLMETVHLLKSRANATRLYESLQQMESGEVHRISRNE